MGIGFEFCTSPRIIFGNGKAKELPQLISSGGKKLLLVTGKNPDRAAKLFDSHSSKGFDIVYLTVDGEPTVRSISAGVDFFRLEGCDVVAGVGGGSVIDSAKAIAALATNPGPVMDYLEVIGHGKPLVYKPLPFIAVPTTAGTGAEVTKNAVIHSPENRVKVSLRSPLMFPEVAIIDPEMTLTMPPEITASTGMDALTHLMETFVSNQSNPLSDNLCLEGMKRIACALKRAYDNGADVEAREGMALASMLGGMALANVKLGAVHGFAGPLGGMFPIPHGTVCALLLPAVMKTNISALKERGPKKLLLKYDEVARILTGNMAATAEDGTAWVQEMVNYLNIKALSDFNVTENDFPELVQKARNSSSMKGNPVELTERELIKILGQC
jgi:alcohol dehydrogenase class IV